MESCTGCSLTYRELSILTEDAEQLDTLIFAHNLIKISTNCTYCGKLVQINNTYKFRCNGKETIKKNCKKMMITCNFNASAFAGSWFGLSRLPIKDILCLTKLWTQDSITIDHAATEIRIGRMTVTRWFQSCRDLVKHFEEKKPFQIGGSSGVVEVDEMKIFNGDDTPYGSLWVLGGIERSSRDMFLVPFKHNDPVQFLEVIKSKVVEGTTIITNLFHNEVDLSEFGYLSIPVKLSRNKDFVDSVTGAHIQNIVRQWRDIKAKLPSPHFLRFDVAGYCAEYIFKHKHRDEGERYHHFLLAASELYEPTY